MRLTGGALLTGGFGNIVSRGVSPFLACNWNAIIIITIIYIYIYIYIGFLA